MNKEEFLSGLQRALTGNVPQSVIDENMAYYKQYIAEQVKRGYSETEVIGEIGDPRLIAKTIEETTEGEDGPVRYERFSAEEGTSRSNQYDRSKNENVFNFFQLNKWYHKLAAIAIVALVIVVLIAFVVLLAHFSIPIILVMLIIWFIRKLQS